MLCFRAWRMPRPQRWRVCFAPMAWSTAATNSCSASRHAMLSLHKLRCMLAASVLQTASSRFPRGEPCCFVVCSFARVLCQRLKLETWSLTAREQRLDPARRFERDAVGRELVSRASRAVPPTPHGLCRPGRERVRHRRHGKIEGLVGRDLISPFFI